MTTRTQARGYHFAPEPESQLLKDLIRTQAITRARDRRAWLAAIALCFFLFAVMNLARGVDAWSDKFQPRPALREFTVNLGDCTPPNVILTPLVTFTVREAEADGDQVIGCTRYEKRPIPIERVVSR
jgi:hypothetical protein